MLSKLLSYALIFKRPKRGAIFASSHVGRNSQPSDRTTYDPDWAGGRQICKKPLRFYRNRARRPSLLSDRRACKKNPQISVKYNPPSIPPLMKSFKITLGF